MKIRVLSFSSIICLLRIIGIVLLGFGNRRRWTGTAIKNTRVRHGLLATLVVATVFGNAGIVSADVIVNSRHSLSDFDVAAVAIGEFQRRNVDDDTMALTGVFSFSEIFEASVTNGHATGFYSHTDDVINTGAMLNITSSALLEGSASQSGSSVASSSITEFLHVNFSVTGAPASYTMTGNFTPTDSFNDEIFLTETLGGPDAFRYSTAQSFNLAGTLPVGDYVFRVNNGRLTRDNGPSFSGGHNFTLNVTSIPEPQSLLLIGFLGSMLVFRRRRSA